MKKRPFFIILLIIVFFSIAGFYLYKNYKENKLAKEKLAQETAVLKESTSTLVQNDPNIEQIPTLPTQAVKYKITQAKIGYAVFKDFLNKTDITVDGTTDIVTGSGWLDKITSSYYFKANLNFNDLHTDNPKRDTDVQKLITNPEITAEIYVQEDENIKLDQEIKLQVPVKLTINGIKRIESFTVTTTIKDNEVVAKGETKTLMSNYGVTPPSLLNMFTVGDDLTLYFEFTAKPEN